MLQNLSKIFSGRKTPEFWSREGIVSQLLLPLTVIYFICKRIFSSHSKPQKFNCKIITVGNPVVGGAGKTPTAIAIYKMLKSLHKGRKICFLSKGYGGVLKGPILADLEKHQASEIGDEPVLLAAKAPVIISKDRLKGVEFADKEGFDIVITDDGLHDDRFGKSLNLAVIDGPYGLGNRLVLPSGPLRDRIDLALRNVENVLIVGEDKKETTEYLKKRVGRKFNILRSDIKVTSKHDPKGIYLAFAGIARPQKFFDTLNDLKLYTCETVEFPDHHAYSEDDIKYLKEISAQNKAKLITTEKDYVKLPEKFKKEVDCVKIELNFADKKKVEKLL